MRMLLCIIALGLFLCTMAAAQVDQVFAPVEDDPKLPRVLLIGDSISIGYTLPVRSLLAGKANVHRPPCNCQSTDYALEHIKEWLGTGKWDVIHFNWGIWDAHHLEDGSVRTTPQQYEKNLRQLVSILKSTKAKLIWATTTPLQTSEKGSLWVKNSDIPAYGAIAKTVMLENNVAIDDLYSAVLPHVGEFRCDDGCHYKPEGSEFLAKLVAKSIEAADGAQVDAVFVPVEEAVVKVDPVFAPVTDDPKLPRVLLIGDSISMGYTLPVRSLLAGKANVHRVPKAIVPCTGYALEHIKEWLGTGKWDVIHFNWGIWDAHHLEDGKVRTTPEQYEKNLRQLLSILKSTKAKLIWATTTPLQTSETGSLWVKNSDIPAYGAIARTVMLENNVAIDDLYSAVLPHVGEFRCDDGCHYKPEGSEFLAKLVAKSIEAALPQ